MSIWQDLVTNAFICETDDVPVCSERAAQHLALMLSGTHRDALGEWLTVLASSGKRVRESLLPSLLNYGITNKEHREAIFAVLGKRGVWLAAQNPQWGYVVSTDIAEEIWQTGNSEERLSALQQIRKTDAAKALGLLSQSWQQESPQDRERFIEVLHTGLSMDDEPFLENALDDKQKEVRRAAIKMLITLPESRLVNRMIERALPLLEYKPGLQPRLEVTLPEECTKAMMRDGMYISTNPRDGELEQKSTWLYYILGAVPIQFWRERWKITAKEILQLADENEWRSPLIGAWLNAAQRIRDSEMADALLEYSLAKEWSGFEPKALLNLFPVHRQEEIMPALIQFYGAQEGAWSYIIDLVTNRKFQWSQHLTRSLLDCIYRHVKAGDKKWKYILQYYAFHLSPATALETIANWKLELDKVKNDFPLEQSEQILCFRIEMLAELAL